MNADELRTVAQEIRDTASKATPGRWKLWGMEVRADQDGSSDVNRSSRVAGTTHEAGLRTFNASHIAAWQPAVALAVADWVDEEASHPFGPTEGLINFVKAWRGES